MSAKHGVVAAEKFGQRECCRCEENWSKRKRVLEDDVFIENMRLVSGSKNAGVEFTRADVVVSISRGPPGQWFPETEH